MFHWICPECGREIAPTVRECPACDPNAAVAEPALVGVVEAPTGRLLNAAAPAARLLNAAAPTARVLNAEAPTARLPDVHAPAARTLDTEDRAGPQPAAVGNRPAPVERSYKTIAASEPADALLPQFGEWPSSNSDPLAALSALLDPPAAIAEPPRALRFPIAVAAAPPALRAWIAELSVAAQPPCNPVRRPWQSKLSAEPPLVIGKAALPPGPARVAAKPMGARLLALSTPWETPAGAARPVRPQTPYPGLAPAMAPLANYSPLAGRPLRPAVPARNVHQNECGPRITLPGPMLTAPLVRFQDRELNPIPTAARALLKKRLVPGWLASVLIIGTILAAGFNSVFSIVPRSASAVKPGAAGAVEAAASAVPAASQPVPASPLSKAIEVTGFRIQVDPGKKSEIQYLVVNHTAHRFAGVTVYVTLRAADAPAGQPPLGRFQFAAPNLGAFESKEMSSAIERVTRPITLPDWQDLRADVEIGQ